MGAQTEQKKFCFAPEIVPLNFQFASGASELQYNAMTTCTCCSTLARLTLNIWKFQQHYSVLHMCAIIQTRSGQKLMKRFQ